VDCNENVCNECICSEAHRGHSFKTLKTLYKEVESQTKSNQDILKVYHKQLEDGEYSLKVLKILKEDRTNNGIYSIIGNIKNFLQSQSQRISSSFGFIDKIVDDAALEKFIVISLMRETNICFEREINFQTVDDMKQICQKISKIVKKQKHVALNNMADEYKFKSLNISQPPIELEFHVPMDEILVPENKVYQVTGDIKGLCVSISKHLIDRDRRDIFIQTNITNKEDNLFSLEEQKNETLTPVGSSTSEPSDMKLDYLKNYIGKMLVPNIDSSILHTKVNDPIIFKDLNKVNMG